MYLTLPSTVDTGDVPIVVTVSSASSRDTSTAPHITINSGGSPIPNPVDATAFFVRQQYLDFLNREPDADGLAFWQNQINACGSDAHAPPELGHCWLEMPEFSDAEGFLAGIRAARLVIAAPAARARG